MPKFQMPKFPSDFSGPQISFAPDPEAVKAGQEKRDAEKAALEKLREEYRVKQEKLALARKEALEEAKAARAKEAAETVKRVEAEKKKRQAAQEKEAVKAAASAEAAAIAAVSD